MKIQLNTDRNISNAERLETFVSEKIAHSLKHFVGKISRIEVHLSDQNADKGGIDDIHCKLEARLEGKRPIMVLSKSDTKEKALDAAVNKMKAALDTTIGKMRT